MTETLHPSSPDTAPSRRLARTRDGRWLGGVASGLGAYFDVNPLVYRIAFAALVFAGGMGLFLYAAAWLVIPAEDREDSIAVEALREHRQRPWLLLGVGLLLLFAAVTLSQADLWSGTGELWFAAVLAGAGLLWWHLAHRDDAPPGPSGTTTAVREPRPPSLWAPVVGALLAAAGVLGLVAVFGIWSIDAEVALAAAVAVVGGAVAGGALTGRRVGWLVPLGLVLLVAFLAAAASPVSFSSGAGERVERPADAAALSSSYEFGIGELTLDLGAVELPPGETRVDVSLGVGELIVTVPAGAALEIDATAGVGEIDVLGDRDEGVAARRRTIDEGVGANPPVLVLDANVGFGAIEVRRG